MLSDYEEGTVETEEIIPINRIDKNDASEDELDGMGQPNTAFYYTDAKGEKVLIAIGYQFACGNSMTRWFGKKSTFCKRVIMKTNFYGFRGRLYQSPRKR